MTQAKRYQDQDGYIYRIQLEWLDGLTFQAVRSIPGGGEYRLTDLKARSDPAVAQARLDEYAAANGLKEVGECKS